MSDEKKAARTALLGITKDNMLFTLPPALKEDESTEALAEATAGALVNRLAETDRLRIICNIDNLEEPLLAILAHDFKVDWWDPSYSLEEKRKTVKGSWRVHKLLGTKAAVETALRAVYPNTTVEEWFEYGGKPFHFRIWINLTDDDIDSDRMRRILDRLIYYKSLRSHNDDIWYFIEPEKQPQAQANVLYTGCFSEMGVRVQTEPKPVPAYQVHIAPGVAISATEVKLETEKIRVNAEIPRYAANAKMGVGVGTICMSMDVNI